MMSDDRLMAQSPAEGDFDPCFAFSVHKCGSTLMHSMIKLACKKAGIPALSVPDIMFNLGEISGEWQRDPDLIEVFRKRMLFLGFRNLPEILTNPQTEIGSRRFVLLVRDPRDALVSQYFSFGRKNGSHTAPKENPEAFRQRLEKMEDTEIDDYVLQAAPGLLRKLIEYRDNLNHSLGLLRRYEDIFFDKETFLAEIFEHFGLSVERRIIVQVAGQHDIRPEQEDDTKHIRKGTPGDHREKLTPRTIEKLNDTFSEIGAFYGYRF